jgi:hypothetical protein
MILILAIFLLYRTSRRAYDTIYQRVQCFEACMPRGSRHSTPLSRRLKAGRSERLNLE